MALRHHTHMLQNGNPARENKTLERSADNVLRRNLL